MIKKKTNLLLLAGLGVGAYFLLKGMKNKSASKLIETEGEAEKEETSKEGKTMPTQTEVDAVIDTKKENLTVEQAIQRGKILAKELGDGNVVIKTPEGLPNITIKTGLKARIQKALEKRKKRRTARKQKRSLKRTKKVLSRKCTKIKNKKKREACQRQQAQTITRGILTKRQYL